MLLYFLKSKDKISQRNFDSATFLFPHGECMDYSSLLPRSCQIGT